MCYSDPIFIDFYDFLTSYEFMKLKKNSSSFIVFHFKYRCVSFFNSLFSILFAEIIAFIKNYAFIFFSAIKTDVRLSIQMQISQEERFMPRSAGSLLHQHSKAQVQTLSFSKLLQFC